MFTRHITRTLAALVLLFSVHASAWADDIEDAAAAYVRGDYESAFRLTRPLAEQGHALAQFRLGTMYFEGKGVPQDYVEAAKWFQLSAEQGNALAQTSLGIMYFDGKGVSQDYVEAAKWVRLSAEQGRADAQLILGRNYIIGAGVPQDYVLAHMWINLSAAQGYQLDDVSAAKLRDELASNMTPAQIEEAQRLAREWLAAHPQ